MLSYFITYYINKHIFIHMYHNSKVSHCLLKRWCKGSDDIYSISRCSYVKKVANKEFGIVKGLMTTVHATIGAFLIFRICHRDMGDCWVISYNYHNFVLCLVNHPWKIGGEDVSLVKTSIALLVKQRFILTQRKRPETFFLKKKRPHKLLLYGFLVFYLFSMFEDVGKVLLALYLFRLHEN